MESPFEILGVDSDADDAEIERAYRRRVKESHPDHGGSAEEFKAVYAAYREILDGYEETGTDDGADADRPWRRGNADETGGDEGGEEESEESRVEFLNYEVLDDHGWKLDDDDLFEKASAAGLDPADYGEITVEPNQSLLEAAEEQGFAWPYACRGGACANCAVAVIDGEMEMDSSNILPSEMIADGIRLSCLNGPVTDEMKVVYNVKHLPNLDELKLPPDRFERAHLND
ncbi:ferredoxin Fer [Halopelagius longus]|uniref:Ferredoxin n=1 Tax=Halopelagius longus TaxID=1236180 RepID=A0A370IGW0_9EURY|nr:ferredoxin Fer [Halopelagius longus]RDI69946.1 ferredoxin [Halopelagius longus]